MGKSKSDIDEIIEEAREGFDLRARLQGVRTRTKQVTVFTDDETGALLGGAEDVLIPGTEIVSGRRRWGVQGELDEIAHRAEALAKRLEGSPSPEDEDALSAEAESLNAQREKLTRKAASLIKKLRATSLTFTLRSVPELVVRDTRRKARNALGIKSKGIEGREEEFSLEYTAILLAASVDSWTDAASGQTFDELTVRQAKDLYDFLPVGQFAKLDRGMTELSMQASIGEYGTDSADF
jgi:seryl-tRNA synthetase